MISVIIRMYNSGNTIRTAVQSAIGQTPTPEIIIIDDGSTDSGNEKIKDLIDGKNIKYIRQQNQGAIKALNCGIKEASGEFVIILDADDHFEQTILEELQNAIKTANADFAYCDYYEESNGKRKVVSTKNFFHCIAGGVLIKKNLIAQLGAYREDLNFPEYDLFIKLQKYKGVHIAKPLFTYKRHEGSITARKEYVETGMKQLKQLYPDFDITKIRKY